MLLVVVLMALFRLLSSSHWMSALPVASLLGKYIVKGNVAV